MNSRYLKRLPDEVQEMVERIEAAVGREIVVEVNPHPPNFESADPYRLGVQVTADSATIFIQTDEIFPPSGVVHELLHIQRFWLEAVPKLRLPYDLDLNRATIVDNALEHLVILPRQKTLGYLEGERWNRILCRAWERYSMFDIERDIRLWGIMSWLQTVRITPVPSLLEMAERALIQKGMLDAARLFERELVVADHAKEEMVMTTLRHAEIPYNMASLEYFDPIAGVSTVRELR